MEVTLPTEEQIWGSDALDVIKDYGIMVAPTDLAVVLGCIMGDSDGLKTIEGEIPCASSTASRFRDEDVCCVHYQNLNKASCGGRFRESGVRPVLSPSDTSFISPSRLKTGPRGTMIVEYGKYPQTLADASTSKELENLFNFGSLRSTGKIYTFDSVDLDDRKTPFAAIEYQEYELNSKKYIRVPGRPANR